MIRWDRAVFWSNLSIVPTCPSLRLRLANLLNPRILRNQGHSCPRPGSRECLESFFGSFRRSRYNLGFRKRSPKGSNGCRAKDVSFGYDLQVAFEKTMPILMSEYALWHRPATG